jgi:sucrose-6-phosphate hydrolase SacC (GH32 family)
LRIWECPSLSGYLLRGNPIKKVGVDEFLGGAGKPIMQYFIGDFNGKTFINDNPPDKILLVDYGDCLYAGIP